MAKQQIQTLLLGRQVRLGWSLEQIYAWSKENPGKDLDVVTIPREYSKYGQEVGEVVSIYADAEGDIRYDVLVKTDLLVGLYAKTNISEIIPPEKPAAASEYLVIGDTSFESLAYKVMQHQQDGWRLQGGVAITTGEVAQAMVRP